MKRIVQIWVPPPQRWGAFVKDCVVQSPSKLLKVQKIRSAFDDFT